MVETLAAKGADYPLRAGVHQRRAHRGADLEDDVRQSIARIKASPFVVHKHEIRGFVYEVETGRLREVK